MPTLDKAGNLPALTIESNGSIQSSMNRGQMLDPAKDTLGTWDEITIGQLQSKCLVKSKLSDLWLVEDEQQWSWDPGGC